MNAATFTLSIAVWLLIAAVTVLRLAGVRWPRRSRTPTTTLCAALAMWSAMLFSQYAHDRNWPPRDCQWIDVACMLMAAAFLVFVLRDARLRPGRPAGRRAPSTDDGGGT
jgi:cytochrome bd-type quinol oxidase subunit 2